MLKENINTIDFKLKNYFNLVRIVEKSEKNKFIFELNLMKEKNNSNINLIVDIDKEFLNQNIFDIKWNYMSNPNDETSHVNRKSSGIDNLISDIIDIVEKNKFDSKYLESIKS